VSTGKKLINAILPPVPKTDDRQTLQFFSAIKQALDEIKNSVVVSRQGVVSRIGSDAAKDELAAAVEQAVLDPDALKTPSAVVNLSAAGTVTNINLSWDYPATGTNVGYFEVFRNTTDAQGTATIRGTTGASVFSDNAEPRQQYYYWVRGVSSGGVTGPFQSSAGVSGITAENPLTTLATAQCGIVCSNLAQALLSDFPAISGADCALCCAQDANTAAGNAASAAATANIAAGTACTIASCACTIANCACTAAITAQCCINTTDGNLAATYVVKTNVDGNIAGFGLYNNACTSDFQILADSFAVVAPVRNLSTCQFPSGSSGATTLAGPNGSADLQLSGYTRWASTCQCDSGGNVCAGPSFPHIRIRNDTCAPAGQCFLAEVVIANAHNLNDASQICLVVPWIRVRNTSGSIGIVYQNAVITPFIGIGPPGPNQFFVCTFTSSYVGNGCCFYYQFQNITSGSYTPANGYYLDSVSYELYEGATKVPFVVCNNQVFIDTATIGDASISSAMIQCVCSDQISATCLSALSTNAGCITAGVLRSTDGDFVIDLTNKNITITV
jgi:hypothetical protein